MLEFDADNPKIDISGSLEFSLHQFIGLPPYNGVH